MLMKENATKRVAMIVAVFLGLTELRASFAIDFLPPKFSCPRYIHYV
jgi:hypothetical protein